MEKPHSKLPHRRLAFDHENSPIALDRCQLSMRDSVFIPEATIEAFGYNTDEFPIKRLPIVILYVNKEQLIAVPRLESSSGSRQAQAVWNAIVGWNLEDKV
ncbi:hypothetical protein J437_LFUL018936 [Ladona fulva]|uniref:Uncharacterized protein n=1 Tax=Ladona fulva TaxID=123851 RepID=A0A8K0KRI0_LADFU|nr:hypothetical protein J437_LFUL018936 [Ladona fulva]